MFLVDKGGALLSLRTRAHRFYFKAADKYGSLGEKFLSNLLVGHISKMKIRDLGY